MAGNGSDYEDFIVSLERGGEIIVGNITFEQVSINVHVCF